METDAHKKLVQEQFTRTADDYAQWATVEAGDAKSDVAFFAPAPGDVALDVACGPGTLSLKLAPLVREVTGVDITEELLVRAREKASARGFANARFASGDVEKLAFPDASFDLVLCGSAMHHFPEAEKVFREMLRVCRPGGRIGIIDIGAPEADDQFAYCHRLRRLKDPSHARAWKPSEFRALYERHGLGSLRGKVVPRKDRFSRWVKASGIEEGTPLYRELRALVEGSIEGDRTGWQVRRLDDGDLELNSSYTYVCGVKA